MLAKFTQALHTCKPPSGHQGSLLAGQEGTYNSEAHDESPETSPWVCLYGLPDAHLMLTVLAVEGIVHHVLVDQDIAIAGLLRNIDMFAPVRLLGRLDVTLRRHVSDVRAVSRHQRGE